MSDGPETLEQLIETAVQAQTKWSLELSKGAWVFRMRELSEFESIRDQANRKLVDYLLPHADELIAWDRQRSELGK